VSTCNRIEFYFVAKKGPEPFELVRTFYNDFKKIDTAEWRDIFYIRKNRHAANHLFRVASGIDSMVLGENQIMSQIKDAYSSACAVKAAGKVIHRLFHQAFRVGKLVRADTEMGKGSCSVSSAAIELLKTHLRDMKDPSILFIGINQMISLAASGLNRLEYNRFSFANRTPERAVQFAAKYNSQGYSLDKIPLLLGSAEVVISCTGSSRPVITKSIIDNFSASHGEKKLIILDLAVPRDVEIDNSYNSNIEVMDIEDIHRFVRDQQERRRLAVPQAEEIIGRKLNEFVYWFDHVRYEPIYNGLYDAFENLRREEMESALNRLPPEYKTLVNTATRNLVNKLVQLKLRISANTEDSE
jgi:glutamyl-tRNA reductase